MISSPEMHDSGHIFTAEVFDTCVIMDNIFDGHKSLFKVKINLNFFSYSSFILSALFLPLISASPVQVKRICVGSVKRKWLTLSGITDQTIVHRVGAKQAHYLLFLLPISLDLLFSSIFSQSPLVFSSSLLFSPLLLLIMYQTRTSWSIDPRQWTTPCMWGG